MRSTRADARSLQTDRAIRDEVEKMMVEMGRPQITVSELARRVGIHRKTFYLHNYIKDEACDFFSEQLKAAIDRDGDTVELLAYFIAHGLNGMFRHCFLTGQPVDSKTVKSWVSALGDAALNGAVPTSASGAGPSLAEAQATKEQAACCP